MRLLLLRVKSGFLRRTNDSSRPVRPVDFVIGGLLLRCAKLHLLYVVQDALGICFREISVNQAFDVHPNRTQTTDGKGREEGGVDALVVIPLKSGELPSTRRLRLGAQTPYEDALSTPVE